MKNKKIAFFGAGNMAGAIITGLLSKDAAGTDPADIIVFDIDKSKCERFADRGVRAAADEAEAVSYADYIILAVKPQNYRELLTKIKDCGASLDGKLFISIAAGISTDSVISLLGREVPVVRTMPNTPLLIGLGVTALCRSKMVSDSDFAAACGIFASMGSTLILGEDKLNSIISVTSSSPAYVYLLIKSLCDGAKAQGIECENLLNAVCDTVIGSATLAKNSDKTPDELIKMVCSKGGTTERAMNELENGRFEDTVIRAMKKCTERAEELGRGI